MLACFQNLLVLHEAIASSNWLLLFRPSNPLGAVLLFCQEPPHVRGLSGQRLGSRETTQVENGSFCLAASTYKQTAVPNAGLVLRRGKAGFLPRTWVSPVLPASPLYQLAKLLLLARVHVCYANISIGTNHGPAVNRQGDSWVSIRNGAGNQRLLHRW